MYKGVQEREQMIKCKLFIEASAKEVGERIIGEGSKSAYFILTPK